MKKYIIPQIDVIVISTDEVMLTVLTASGETEGQGWAEGYGAATLDFGQLK